MSNNLSRNDLVNVVPEVLANQPVTDMHTHCYPPTFGDSGGAGGGAGVGCGGGGGGGGGGVGGLLLWGIDELVTYHYLVAEVYRVVPECELPIDKFWSMSKSDQADHIWKHLFVERTPMSEACRGVLTTLNLLGLDPNEKTLDSYRQWFGEQTADGYIDRVMELANVDSITMTNAVFDDPERVMWENDRKIADDPRFEAVLRIDPLLRDWPGAVKKMASWGYDVTVEFSQKTIDETKRFLNHWLDYMNAIYVAMSLPPEFRYPNVSDLSGNRFIADILMPVLAERGLPFAMMIGCHQQVKPELRDAGDMVGKSDVQSVVNLCRDFPKNKFFITMLSRENQHELCVATRKFGNLMLFGCWWFLNNPSIIEEMTRERLELLGTSFIPQHSDARVLDQLIYKWSHSRGVIGNVLVDKYSDMIDAGYRVQRAHIERDARLMLRDNFREFCKR